MSEYFFLSAKLFPKHENQISTIDSINHFILYWIYLCFKIETKTKRYVEKWCIQRTWKMNDVTYGVDCQLCIFHCHCYLCIVVCAVQREFTVDAHSYYSGGNCVSVSRLSGASREENTEKTMTMSLEICKYMSCPLYALTLAYDDDKNENDDEIQCKLNVSHSISVFCAYDFKSLQFFF